MNIFKAAFKKKPGSHGDTLRSGGIEKDSHSVRSTQLASDSRPNRSTLASMSCNTAQSQPNLSRGPMIQSNFDPSVILPSINSADSPLPQPDECIQKALHLHEQGKLEPATDLLKIAASQNHPLGLFLLGISLRHGWGCEVDPLLAFQCLQHSAESAIVDLNTIKNSDCSAAKHELTIAIHELGICFRHGWGVSRNKETAAYYFELAANLGDPDSQNELGYCYMHGDGVKKDLHRAAFYFRLAHEQGMGQVGNSWIFKDKYNQPPP